MRSGPTRRFESLRGIENGIGSQRGKSFVERQSRKHASLLTYCAVCKYSYGMSIAMVAGLVLTVDVIELRNSSANKHHRVLRRSQPLP